MARTFDIDVNSTLEINFDGPVIIDDIQRSAEWPAPNFPLFLNPERPFWTCPLYFQWIALWALLSKSVDRINQKMAQTKIGEIF